MIIVIIQVLKWDARFKAIDHDNCYHSGVAMGCEIQNDNKTKCIIIIVIIETNVYLIKEIFNWIMNQYNITYKFKN